MASAPCDIIDERRGLGVLLRFHEGSLDPGFFYYPTLLYYIVYALGELLGGPQVFLAVGRAVTLLAGAALGIATFWMVRLLTQSYWAALFAALLLLWNPVLAESASYMSTDLLTALFVTIALGCCLKAIRDASAGAWALAFVFAGLATSAKYNAAILVLALMLSDVLRATPVFAMRSRAADFLNRSLPPVLLRATLLVIGAALILAATLTPMEFFVGMLRSSAELNSVVDSADIAFI
ncbi:MAG: glycosyltransferase family 39 protein, partial [Longimicrobiales bacterium]